MNRLYIAITAAAAYLLPTSLAAQSAASFRILFGVTDSAPTRWDGTVSVGEGKKFDIQPWRFEGADGISGPLFHITTHPARLFSGSTPTAGAIIVANGFLLTVSGVTESTAIAITTAQGNFRFTPADLKYGTGLYKLGGRVYIDPVPASKRLSNAPGKEDYPATASAPNGDVWLAYVEFHHSPDYLGLRVSPKPTPTDFSTYKQPTGSDQIWARKYSNGAWGQPIAITEKGGDLYRPAVAVDGRGWPWVFWSENTNGNFDVFARAIEGSAPKERIRISSEPGSDVTPAAVRNSQGNILVAWQGWRDGRAAIWVAEQRGDQFSAASKISNSNANEWNPAIAARYEAYPSIAYDGTGRLWIAYQEGGKGWGKDFGAYSSPGIALYQGRLVRLCGLESSGRLVDLDSNLDQSLVGVPTLFADRSGSQAESDSVDPNPQNAQQRRPDQTAANNLRAAKNALPRLTIDDSGRAWLAFRSAHPIWWSPLGTVWTEYLVSYDGKSDAAAVAKLHSYRGGPDGSLHVIRGEFHRHSEISMDAGNDGTIIDHDNGGGRE